MASKKSSKKPAKLSLPDKPSALIRVALEDLEAVERSKKYVVNMGTWHEPQSNSRCEVCLAGAVIAKRLGANPNELLYPESARYENAGLSGKLNALDSFRQGDVCIGLEEMGLEEEGIACDLDCTIENYHSNPERFKVEMKALAYRLEDEGL